MVGKMKNGNPALLLPVDQVVTYYYSKTLFCLYL